MLDRVTQAARDAVTTLGYPGIFAAMVVECLFPPVPSEVVLPLAGFEVNSGDLNFLLVVLSATLGSVAGALILYAIGRYGGRPAVLRYGRVLRVDPEDLSRAERWFERWGDWMVLGSRLVPLVRSVVSVPAGVMRMSVLRFTVLTAIGSFVWNLLLVRAGYQLGANWDEVTALVESYALVIRVGVVLAAVAVAWWACRRVARAR